MEDKNLDTELWRDIKGYEGFYQVSSHGRVRSLDRVVHTDDVSRRLRGCMLSLNLKHRTGYVDVTLHRDGILTTKRVHLLVCEAFLVRTPGQTHINHKDSNKANNKLSNLEFCTPSENQLHATKYGNRFSRKVRNTVTGEIFVSINAAARSVGGQSGNLNKTIQRGTSYKGVKYEYVGPQAPSKKRPGSRPVVCKQNGIRYKSIAAASRALGLATTTIAASANNLVTYTKTGFSFVFVD